MDSTRHVATNCAFNSFCCACKNSSPIVSAELNLCIGREFGAARGHLVGRACHSMTPSHGIHNVLSVYISLVKFGFYNSNNVVSLVKFDVEHVKLSGYEFG